jgi:hypothetical protein
VALWVEGVSKMEKIKYGMESRRTQTREGLRWLSKEQSLSGPLVREGGMK